MKIKKSDEIPAFATICKALDALDEPARLNVLNYVSTRYKQPAVTSVGAEGNRSEESRGRAAARYETFAELKNAAKPATDAERALVAGFWAQICGKQENFGSQAINDELKHVGKKSENITRDLDSLMQRDPALVIQVAKSGTSKQARKKYKLTTEGVDLVNRMIAGTVPTSK